MTKDINKRYLLVNKKEVKSKPSQMVLLDKYLEKLNRWIKLSAVFTFRSVCERVEHSYVNNGCPYPCLRAFYGLPRPYPNCETVNIFHSYLKSEYLSVGVLDSVQ